MNGLFIEFRDPLFGIIIFVALVFIIALASYWWGRMRSKEDHRYLERFLRSFNHPVKSGSLKQAVASDAVSSSSWLLIAQGHVRNGDYEKAVEIYSALSESQREPHRKRETLFLLAQTYFKAGFLERSEKILLQILGRFPRTPQALRLLLLAYEKLGRYDQALEVLDSLEELGEDVDLQRRYLQTLKLIKDPALSSDDKMKALAETYTHQRQLTYLVFEQLLRFAPAKVWELMDDDAAATVADLLWYLDASRIDLDIISEHTFLRQLYSARGDVNLAQSSPEFVQDVLIKLRRCGHRDADLRFEYLCRNCKQLFPFAFYRCPHCHSIDTVLPEATLADARGNDETSNTF